MGRYLIKLNELDEKNKYLEENILEIKEYVKNISNLMNSVNWVSPTKEKITIQYNEYIDSLNKMITNLEGCLKVSKKYYENYTNGYRTIKTDFKKVVDELEDRNAKYRIFNRKH